MGIMRACVYKQDNLILMYPRHLDEGGGGEKIEDEFSQIFSGWRCRLGVEEEEEEACAHVCLCVSTNKTQSYSYVSATFSGKMRGKNEFSEIF